MQITTGVSLLDNIANLTALQKALKCVGFNDLKIFPKIVIIGNVLVGNCSLLEHILGFDFLPRGQSFVTRRPIELKLQQASCPQIRAEFVEEIKGKLFINLEEVRTNINFLTEKMSGKLGLKERPIRLKIEGSKFPDITIIDLPEIGRGKLSNEEEVIIHLGRMGYSDTSLVILFVFEIYFDPTSIYLFPKQPDPESIRTIGILTTMDITDQATVSNRFQQQEEPLIYQYDEVSLKITGNCVKNISLLTKTISKIFLKNIRLFLPQQLREINQQVNNIEKKLQILGPEIPVNKTEKMHYVWRLIYDFSIKFKVSTTGGYTSREQTNSSNTPARCKINSIFQQLYYEFIDLDYKPLNKFTDEDILKIIYKYQGQDIAGFMPVDAFYALLKPELQKLAAPERVAFEQVYEVLEENAIIILNSQLSRFSNFQQPLKEFVLQILQECKNEANNVVQDAIEAEMNYIFTNDQDYLSGKPFGKFKQNGLLNNKGQSNMIVAALKNKIEHYIQLVVRSIRDNVPKLIGYHLVIGCQTKMFSKLQYYLIQNQQILDSVTEDQNIVEERKILTQEIKNLRNIQKIIRKDLQYDTFKQQSMSIARESQAGRKLIEIEKENLQMNKEKEKQSQLFEERFYKQSLIQLHHQQMRQLSKQRQQEQQLKNVNNEKKLDILNDIITEVSNNQDVSKNFQQYYIAKSEQQQLKILKEDNKMKPILSIQQLKQDISQDNMELLFYVIADNLRRENRELIITEKSQKTGLTTSLLFAESSDSICYKFVSQEANFSEMKSDEQAQSQYIYQLKYHIASNINSQITDIEVLDIQENTNVVYFRIKSKKHLSVAELEVLKNVCNGNIEVYNYFACGYDGILGNLVGLSSKDFNPQYNMKWGYVHKTSEVRGPPYHRYEYFFPRGYSGYALNVNDRYGPNNNWIKMNGNSEEWRILYHSTYQGATKPIVQEGLKPGPRQLHKNSICKLTNEPVGQGVYFCNQITTCEKKYAHPTIINNKKFILVFQSRVNPLAIRQSERMKQKGYFLVNETKDIRPYRILLKELKEESSCQIQIS